MLSRIFHSRSLPGFSQYSMTPLMYCLRPGTSRQHQTLNEGYKNLINIKWFGIGNHFNFPWIQWLCVDTPIKTHLSSRLVILNPKLFSDKLRDPPHWSFLIMSSFVNHPLFLRLLSLLDLVMVLVMRWMNKSWCRQSIVWERFEWNHKYILSQERSTAHENASGM